MSSEIPGAPAPTPPAKTLAEIQQELEENSIPGQLRKVCQRLEQLEGGLAPSATHTNTEQLLGSVRTTADRCTAIETAWAAMLQKLVAIDQRLSGIEARLTVLESAKPAPTQ